ncbi:MAG TPA: hypothetical protein VLI92_05160 [Candidatus Saccharimonadales bacterium]|nr:hypothetical protein [Candidatus Saccharimonadales bacterium]
MKNSKYYKILKHFKDNDAIIYNYMQNLDFVEWMKPIHTQKSKGYFAALCRAIAGQQLSGKAANAIYLRFEKLLKDNVTADRILKLTDQQLRDVGMSWAKVRSIKDLAQRVKNKELNLDQIDSQNDVEVVTTLTMVKGIGPWTAEMFLMFTLNRENVFSFKDLGLKKGIEKVYKTKDPSIKKIEKIIKKWEPYKSFGSIALWNSLESQD